MLKSLFNVLLKVSDEAPQYVGERCLIEKNAVGGCDLCLAACPHDAIELSDRVQVVNDACTGCGLCVQVCPTGALEFELPPVLASLKDQGRSSEGKDPVSACLKCSKVRGEGATVLCLGRVTPAMLLASAAWGQQLDLVHGDCNDCRLGGPEVPRSLQAVIETARQYRQSLGAAPLKARMVHWNGEESEPSAPPALAVSRREAMGALFSSAKRTGAKIIPEQVLPGVNTRPEADPVPDEWVWRRRALRPAPADGGQVRWPVPSVDDSCTMCPVCRNVCPTEAINRELGEDGSFTLRLDVAACTGCEACMHSCPPSAISMSETVPYEALSGTLVLREELPLVGQPS